MNPQTRSAVAKALLDLVKDAYEKTRGPADERLRTLYEEEGVLSTEARIPGYPLAVAKMTLTPSEAAVAVDQAARLEWFRKNLPDEVETVTTEQVRPATAKVVMERLKVDDEGNVFDPETGQVIEWARLVPAGPPKTTMTFTPTGRAAIAAAYREGRLPLGELLALEGPDASA